ncbi:aminotransferase class I/II-fold pyridoxal phosphate-dependent enzyme [Cyanobium sp. CH-040]|uniref:aminotransferase class I/II-fold pyridoxal phosphate-dependent enzyme n=1 Tax=Cyanobium sp. CH-040 TaxID=2823708 RepID=UPI0020CDCB84|nr:aminotransferase class I/II-fold pyridoxal phosphate-dependent enzyme [Cyanobium sp. CH-040]
MRAVSQATFQQLSEAPDTPLLDLASNDYLGLSRHPVVVATAQAAAARDGVGAGGSRLVTGTRPVHMELEAELAGWLGRERALLFPSGFQANLAAVLALADRHSLVIADRLIHHSLLTGVAASGARLRRFAHNDLAQLEHRLSEARRARPQQRLLVLSESLFSMEGTSPNVPALAALCERFGAALLLDEAHALGVLGPGGRGLGHGAGSIALISGTFGKAFGSGGAFLAGGELVMEWLLQSSGAFRYTTALAPPLAAGALAALRLIQRRESHAAAEGDGSTPALPDLLKRARRWRDGLEAAGWPRPAGEGPILPLLVGSDGRALELQSQLEAAGLLAVAIRPPTVPEGTARLRLVLRADLPPGTLERLLSALGRP